MPVGAAGWGGRKTALFEWGPSPSWSQEPLGGNRRASSVPHSPQLSEACSLATGALSGPGGSLQQAVCEAHWGPRAPLRLLLDSPWVAPTQTVKSRDCEVRVWLGSGQMAPTTLPLLSSTSCPKGMTNVPPENHPGWKALRKQRDRQTWGSCLAGMNLSWEPLPAPAGSPASRLLPLFPTTQKAAQGPGAAHQTLPPPHPHPCPRAHAASETCVLTDQSHSADIPPGWELGETPESQDQIRGCLVQTYQWP